MTCAMNNTKLFFTYIVSSKRFGCEIRVNMVTKKSVKFNVVCTPGG